MTAPFHECLAAIRRRLQVFLAVFVVCIVALVGLVGLISTMTGDPGPLVYLFALLFAVMVGICPVVGYLLPRWSKRDAVENCPACGRSLWPTTYQAIFLALVPRCPRCLAKLSVPIAVPVETPGSDPLPLEINFTGEDQTPVEFPAEHTTITLRVTEVAPDRYRLDNVPLAVESAAFGDVIEAERAEDGGLRFLRVVEPGRYRTHCFTMHPDKPLNEQVAAVLDEVIARGGHWERVFGGVLIVCLPHDVRWNPTRDLSRACQAS